MTPTLKVAGSIIAAFAGALFMQGCGNNQSPPATTTTTGAPAPTTGPAPAPAPTAAAMPAGWVPYTSAAGKYSVNLPGTPKESSGDQDTAAGKVTTYTSSYSTPTGAYFAVAYDDYANTADMSNTAELLKAAENGSVTNVKATVTSEKEIDLNGIPGREYVGTASNSGQNFVMHCHIYLNGHRLYQLIIVEPAASDNTADPDSMFNSFKINT